MIDMDTLRNRVDVCFEYETEIAEAVAERKLGLRRGTDDIKVFTGRISDPTANTTIRRADEVEGIKLRLLPELDKARTIYIPFPERWLAVIRSTRIRFSGMKAGEFINMKYHRNENMSAICAKLGVSRKTLYTIRLEVLTFGAGMAEAMGLAAKRERK